ncbi:MAG: tRNA (adenosine(37)-N6)-threonylcarbamoyltransferase complex dimerization subunit type 1 TsaB [Candidatus Geothermincolia bacterium]
MPDETLMLAWDTCTEDGVIAIAEGGRAVGGSRFRTVKGHAGWLMPLLDEMVRSAGKEPGDIDIVAAGTGPGSYTGVKVGVSTAKALALGLDVPLVGVPTLDLLAAHAPAGAGPVLACMDARQGLVYAAGYDGGGERLRRVTEYGCVTPSEAGCLVSMLDGGRVTAIGFVPQELSASAAGSGRHVEVIEPRACGFPSGDVLVALANEMIERGLAGDAFSVVPIYLKKPV